MNNLVNDHYKILEIPTTATYDEIKKSYRQLALKHHPDRNSGNKQSQKLFIEINQAYKILSDRKSREKYDVTYKKIQPITPQLFLEKFQNIRIFIFTKGRKKINTIVLYKGLSNLLTDKNINYLHLQNNRNINNQIIEEALQCCYFLPNAEMRIITHKLLILAGSDTKIMGKIHQYIDNHKMIQSNKFISLLTNITHRMTIILDSISTKFNLKNS